MMHGFFRICVVYYMQVTHTALATPAVLARIAARDSPFLRLMHRLLMFFAHTYAEVFSFEHPPLHDPLAVFLVACPAAFKVRRRSFTFVALPDAPDDASTSSTPALAAG